MEQIKLNSSGTLLILCSKPNLEAVEKTAKKMTTNITALHTVSELLSAVQNNSIATASQNAIYIHSDISNESINSDLLSTLLKVLKTSGILVLNQSKIDASELELSLKIGGFINIKIENNEGGSVILANKPNYEIGSVAKLNLKKPEVKQVWKIDDDDDDGDDTIDPDNLLDDEDLKKPDPASLRVCGTTGKRKACKDCSCGLADELAAEAQGGIIDTSNTTKSSCGNCYLGDAFRCAACPYLGMPAFKPGEKVQLPDNFLKSDL